MPRLRPIVAIDGPAGAGKSSIARRLADTLGYLLVDTGAIYRAVALAAFREGIDWSDAVRLTELTEALVHDRTLVFRQVSVAPPSSAPMGQYLRESLPDGKTEVGFAMPGAPETIAPSSSGMGPAGDSRRDVGGVRVFLHGEDVSEAIRAPQVALGASGVSAHAGVRAALLELQRAQGRHGGVVLEGRDIGTVVFPDAEVKFFLTARPEVRARRRYEELVAKGTATTFEATLAEVHLRDAQDTHRPIAPLRKADGAIAVDSSEMSIDHAVAFMATAVAAWIRENAAASAP